MANRTVALVRVSTTEQDIEVQRGQLERWGVAQGVSIDAWYEEDAVSGASAKRPELDRLLADARRGKIGTLVVAALDRLGRSALRVIQNLHELHALGVRVVSLRESLDFSTPAGRLVASVFAHVAEMERDAIRERTKAGLARARARGVKLGQPRLLWSDDDLTELRALRAAGHSLSAIHESKMLRVFDTKDRAVVPSARSMRRALASATG